LKQSCATHSLVLVSPNHSNISHLVLGRDASLKNTESYILFVMTESIFFRHGIIIDLELVNKQPFQTQQLFHVLTQIYRTAELFRQAQINIVAITDKKRLSG